MKPSKEQFLDYENIRQSGITNMFDIRFVCSLSTHGLTKEHCLYIFANYSDLMEEYYG